MKKALLIFMSAVMLLTTFTGCVKEKDEITTTNTSTTILPPITTTEPYTYPRTSYIADKCAYVDLSNFHNDKDNQPYNKVGNTYGNTFNVIYEQVGGQVAQQGRYTYMICGQDIFRFKDDEDKAELIYSDKHQKLNLSIIGSTIYFVQERCKLAKSESGNEYVDRIYVICAVDLSKSPDERTIEEILEVDMHDNFIVTTKAMYIITGGNLVRYDLATKTKINISTDISIQNIFKVDSYVYCNEYFNSADSLTLKINDNTGESENVKLGITGSIFGVYKEYVYTYDNGQNGIYRNNIYNGKQEILLKDVSVNQPIVSEKGVVYFYTTNGIFKLNSNNQKEFFTNDCYGCISTTDNSIIITSNGSSPDYTRYTKDKGMQKFEILTKEKYGIWK